MGRERHQAESEGDWTVDNNSIYNCFGPYFISKHWPTYSKPKRIVELACKHTHILNRYPFVLRKIYSYMHWHNSVSRLWTCACIWHAFGKLIEHVLNYWQYTEHRHRTTQNVSCRIKETWINIDISARRAYNVREIYWSERPRDEMMGVLFLAVTRVFMGE